MTILCVVEFIVDERLVVQIECVLCRKRHGEKWRKIGTTHALMLASNPENLSRPGAHAANVNSQEDIF